MKFIKKHWFIISIIIICILRFIFTYNLPAFYIKGMKYDDYLMVCQMSSLLGGHYLGSYTNFTLIKGVFFPIVLFIINLYRISYTNAFTIFYIVASIYFINALKKVIDNKVFLLILFILLLFNPASYSQDIFQRLYRNSISMIELLLFIGSFINILFNKKEKIIYYIMFGLSLSFMFLTREDNLWTYPVILFVILYKIIKNKNIKTIILSVIPICVLILTLNLVSFINYKNYKIYTYNEIKKSEFHNAYKKILEIKDDEKIHEVSIPKSTLYKLADNSKKFQITREDIDEYYKVRKVKNEIDNGKITWAIRELIYEKFKFKDGRESEKYFKELGDEIDVLFDKGVLEREFVMPSIYMAVPMKGDIYNTFKNCLYTVKYTSTYQDIKTYTNTKGATYKKEFNAYTFHYPDYHHTVNIVKKNKLKYEIIKQIYKYLTIILGVISIIVFIKNIFKFDSITISSYLFLIMYLLIIGGVAYTHTTSFHAIRPIYLANIYILQTIFITINIYKLYLQIIKCKYTNKKV